MAYGDVAIDVTAGQLENAVKNFDTKADKTYVDGELATKANKVDVDNELEKKASIEMVEGGLAQKRNFFTVDDTDDNKTALGFDSYSGTDVLNVKRDGETITTDEYGNLKVNTDNIASKAYVDNANKVISQNSANSETKEVSGKTVVINDISSNPHTIKISGSANDEVNIFGKNLFNSFLQEDKPNISTPLYVDTDGSICRVHSGSELSTTTYLTYNSNDYATLKSGKSYLLFVTLNNNTLSNAYATIEYADKTTSTLECNTVFTPAQDCIVKSIRTHQNISFPENTTSRIQILVVMAKNNEFKYERYKGEPVYEPYKSKQTITLDENGKGECTSRFPHITIDCNNKINVVYNSNLNYPKISCDCLFDGAYNGGTISTDVFATVSDLYSAYDTLLGTENRKLLGYATATDGTADTNYPLYEYTLPCPFEPTNDILSAPTILISAGIHSDEKTAIMATYRFIEQVKNESNTNAKAIRYANTIKVVPCCNPYGYDNTTTKNEGRVNARGVNLNRNFGYNWYAYIPNNAQNNKGTAPYSELETQALKNWIENNSDALFHIDMHNHGYPYSYALTYSATNSLLQRKIFSKMIRTVSPAIYSQRNVDLRSSTHFVEDNTIAGIASESWYLNNIQSATLEQPYGNSSQFSGNWIPFEVDILGNYIIANLKEIKK